LSSLRVGASAPAAACPKPLPSGARGAGHVVRAVFHSLHHLFPDYDTRGSDILAVMNLVSSQLAGRHLSASGFRKGPAVRACGLSVVSRSWGVLLNVPKAPDADHGTAFVYVAHTRRGWRPWYLWLPAASPQGELLP